MAFGIKDFLSTLFARVPLCSASQDFRRSNCLERGCGLPAVISVSRSLTSLWHPPLQVCELGQQLEQGKAHCEALLRRDRLAVDQYFQGLELTLRRKKEACLGALDVASGDVAQAYDPLIQRVQRLQVGWQDGRPLRDTRDGHIPFFYFFFPRPDTDPEIEYWPIRVYS